MAEKRFMPMADRFREMTVGMTTGIDSIKPRILVAGLGNLLLKDDGVGVHAVRALQLDPPPGALIVEVGTAVLDALHLLEWADKILAVDAMAAGGAPGTAYCFGIGDVSQSDVRASLHELSLINALHMVNRNAPPDIVLLGMEPETIDYGLELSPPVAGSLPRLTSAVREIVDCWQEWGSNGTEACTLPWTGGRCPPMRDENRRISNKEY
jgi:hydrogenase maturation protease